MTQNNTPTPNETPASKKNPGKQTSISVPPPKESGRKRRNIRKWVLRLSLALTIVGPLIFIVAAIGHKIGLFSLGFSFGTLTRGLGPNVLMAGLIVSILALILAIIVKPKKGFAVAIIGILVPALGMGYAVQVKNKAQRLPFIHDITTDTQNVPQFGAEIMTERAETEGVNTTDYAGKMARSQDAQGNPTESLVSVLQTRGYPDIRSIVVSDEKDAAFAKAESLARQMGWKIKATNPEAGTIEATDTTFWYGFKDDVIIRLRNSEGGGTLVDIRSISRIGGSDIGKNAERVHEFLDRMKDA
ncbi:DUF1499 domain-containing protein [Litorimonas sp.]|uniref:DUF1499 domain-containing protein n=1 Tax=Litorimonas sp. TaxID=1892381 RepID=UPI003A84234D